MFVLYLLGQKGCCQHQQIKKERKSTLEKRNKNIGRMGRMGRKERGGDRYNDDDDNDDGDDGDDELAAFHHTQSLM